MTYRTHWTPAESVAVQVGSNADIAEGLGVSVDDAGSPGAKLVLNDVGNMEAFVLTGDPDDFIDLAGRILAQALALRSPDAGNLLRLHIANSEWTFRLPDDDTLMLDANGRRYLGVTMPAEDDPIAVVTWDGDPNDNTTTYPRGNKIDGEGREYLDGDPEPLYRKCAHCHLFVEEQDPDEFVFADPLSLRPLVIARYVHNHRGDEADERLEDHEAEPEPGPGAPLTWWKTWGPPAMRARFVDDETVDVLGQPLPRGRCDTCGSPCDAVTGKCMREPERHVTALG